MWENHGKARRAEPQRLRFVDTFRKHRLQHPIRASNHLRIDAGAHVRQTPSGSRGVVIGGFPR